ncbi:hypothetical protein KFK09_018408 [Dendrobium nobile]|uniref:Uncharacterized protein n=1 Tax=Dendrobium nobile TaxID=94219 RepID=A0A8T3AV53_DENNO|nr:hypothetical protein KFK09_018408 [Dendrobium nobile]
MEAKKNMGCKTIRLVLVLGAVTIDGSTSGRLRSFWMSTKLASYFAAGSFFLFNIVKGKQFTGPPPPPFSISTSLAPTYLTANSLPESCNSSSLMSDPYSSFAPTNAFSELAEQYRLVHKLTLVVDTGDPDLCGGFNNTILKQSESHISEIKAKVSTVPEGFREKSSHHDRDWEHD